MFKTVEEACLLSNVYQSEVQFCPNTMSITVSKAFADNRSVGEIKLPAALFNKTSTFPKLSIRFATCFLLLHNDVHHIV
jgi:hypothetical protein